MTVKRSAAVVLTVQRGRAHPSEGDAGERRDRAVVWSEHNQKLVTVPVDGVRPLDAVVVRPREGWDQKLELDPAFQPFRS